MTGVVFRFGTMIVVLLVTFASCTRTSDEPPPDKTIETPAIADPSAIPTDTSFASELTSDLDSASYTEYLASADDGPDSAYKELKNVTVKYKNGNVKRVCQQKIFENGDVQYHGEFREWWDNGGLWKEGQYQDGQQVGQWKYYYRDAKDQQSKAEGRQLAKQGSYVEGRPEGNWTYFRKDGTRQRIEAYANGRRHGSWLEYERTGEIPLQEFNFREGKRHGASTKWFEPKQDEERRQKYREIEYNEGLQHGKASEWYESGQLKTEIQFKGGKRHGRAAQWDSRGLLVNVMHFQDGELVKKPQDDASTEEIPPKQASPEKS